MHTRPGGRMWVTTGMRRGRCHSFLIKLEITCSKRTKWRWCPNSNGFSYDCLFAQYPYNRFKPAVSLWLLIWGQLYNGQYRKLVIARSAWYLLPQKSEKGFLDFYKHSKTDTLMRQFSCVKDVNPCLNAHKNDIWEPRRIIKNVFHLILFPTQRYCIASNIRNIANKSYGLLLE